CGARGEAVAATAEGGPAEPGRVDAVRRSLAQVRSNPPESDRRWPWGGALLEQGSVSLGPGASHRASARSGELADSSRGFAADHRPVHAPAPRSAVAELADPRRPRDEDVPPSTRWRRGLSDRCRRIRAWGRRLELLRGGRVGVSVRPGAGTGRRRL